MSTEQLTRFEKARQIEWALGAALRERVIDYHTHELCLAALRRNSELFKSLLGQLSAKQADLGPCVPTLR